MKDVCELCVEKGSTIRKRISGIGVITRPWRDKSHLYSLSLIALTCGEVSVEGNKPIGIKSFLDRTR